MLKYLDHADAVHVGEQLRIMQCVDEYEDHCGSAGASEQPPRSEKGIRYTDQGRPLDEIGERVADKVIPDFWKPIEDWMLD